MTSSSSSSSNSSSSSTLPENLPTVERRTERDRERRVSFGRERLEEKKGRDLGNGEMGFRVLARV